MLGLWVTLVVVLQVANVVALGAAWPYLVDVFGVLANAFAFFLVLLLGRQAS